MNTNETQVKGIMIMKSYYEAISDLDGADQLIIFKAIMEFGFNGVEPAFEKNYLKGYWKLIEPTLSRGINSYISKVENGKKRHSKERTESELKDAEAVKAALSASKAETPAAEKITSPQASNEAKDSNLVKYVKSKDLNPADEERFIHLVNDGELKTIAEINQELTYIF